MSTSSFNPLSSIPDTLGTFPSFFLIIQGNLFICLRYNVTVHKKIFAPHITIFDIPIHIIKINLFITLVESVVVYKTICTTHITIIQKPIHLNIITIIRINQWTQTILLRDSVSFHLIISITCIIGFQISINDQWI